MSKSNYHLTGVFCFVIANIYLHISNWNKDRVIVKSNFITQFCILISVVSYNHQSFTHTKLCDQVFRDSERLCRRCTAMATNYIGLDTAFVYKCTIVL